jgi:hypothetical protein
VSSPLLVFLRFIAEHALMLALLFLLATAAGTAVAGRRETLALRMALGLAVIGQVFVLLGVMGGLRPWTLVLVGFIALATGALRMEWDWWTRIRWKPVAAAGIAALPLFLLALYPPIAFDETLYHLPFVRALATTGRIGFLADLRFSAFPQLHELLCVPPFLMLDDVATHLVAVAEVLIVAVLLIRWPRQRETGLLAAALFLGNPIVMQLGTVTYVDVALTLFVAAAFYCLDRESSEGDRWQAAAAGFLLGTACSVKYLGWYFAAGAICYLVLFGRGRRHAIPRFLAAFVAAILPMYGSIVSLTGNPLFPYLPRLFGTTAWAAGLPEAVEPATRVVRVLRVFWDVTFARDRVGWQPPYSPLFGVAVLITLAAAFRSRKAAFLFILTACYIAIFTFLSPDSRYLLPLLPLVSVSAASATWWLGQHGLRVPGLEWRTHEVAHDDTPPQLATRNPNPEPSPSRMLLALSLMSVAPGAAYAGYRMVLQGLPPVSAAQRNQYLEAHVPEYRALEKWTLGSAMAGRPPRASDPAGTLPTDAGGDRLFVCGAEQLKYYGGDRLVGDLGGPFAAGRIFGGNGSASELSRNLAAIGARSLLVSRAHCPDRWQRIPREPEFERIYTDEAADVWSRRDPSAGTAPRK